jgi:rhodanese-related sulfurtransferase
MACPFLSKGLRGRKTDKPTLNSISEVLGRATSRAKAAGLPYAGALLPAEAYALLQQAPGARLIDVRTRAEWNYVGRISGAIEIEWQSFPTGQPNTAFLDELQAQVGKEAMVFFICRSGVRSHAAATLAAHAGYTQAFNVLEGFEGDRDAQGHRNTVGGWRVAGLPWIQT